MKKEKIFNYLQLVFTPCVLILLGLVLLCSPDTASALIGRVLGWGLLVVGILFAAAAFSGKTNAPSNALGAIACIAVAIWLLNDPLVLASGIGRVVGILLGLRGIQDIAESKSTSKQLISGIIMLVGGLILLFLPMTTSRLVFRLLGIAVIIYGGCVLASRLRKRKNTPGLDDPNIIDVDPL